MPVVPQWRPIPGQPQYEVNTIGQVRSRKFDRDLVLKQRESSNGYMCVTLSQGGKYRPYNVHRLVLMAFRGNQQDMYACHIDGDKKNNRLDNLYWGTAAQNASDMKRHGTHRNGRKTHCKNGHEFTPKNTYVQPSSGSRKCITCRDAYCTEWANNEGPARS